MGPEKKGFFYYPMFLLLYLLCGLLFYVVLTFLMAALSVIPELFFRYHDRYSDYIGATYPGIGVWEQGFLVSLPFAIVGGPIMIKILEWNNKRQTEQFKKWQEEGHEKHERISKKLFGDESEK